MHPRPVAGQLRQGRALVARSPPLSRSRRPIEYCVTPRSRWSAWRRATGRLRLRETSATRWSTSTRPPEDSTSRRCSGSAPAPVSAAHRDRLPRTMDPCSCWRRGRCRRLGDVEVSRERYQEGETDPHSLQGRELRWCLRARARERRGSGRVLDVARSSAAPMCGSSASRDDAAFVGRSCRRGPLLDGCRAYLEMVLVNAPPARPSTNASFVCSHRCRADSIAAPA